MQRWTSCNVSPVAPELVDDRLSRLLLDKPKAPESQHEGDDARRCVRASLETVVDPFCHAEEALVARNCLPVSNKRSLRIGTEARISSETPPP